MIERLHRRENLTVAKRKHLVNRALYTNPFWYTLPFDLNTTTVKQNKFQARADINKDFFLTEVRGNFGDVFVRSGGALFDLDIFSTLRQRNLLGYGQNLLPTFISLTEARFDTIPALQLGQDRQREIMPVLIRKSDRIVAELSNSNAVAVQTDGFITLVGFNRSLEYWLRKDEEKRIKASLEIPPRYEIFKFTQPPVEGILSHILENDKFPRMILGFGAVNSTSTKTDIPLAFIKIDDLTRNLQFTNERVPLEFIAPRLTCVEDTLWYYLPTEFYWESFGNLRFEVDLTFQNATAEGFDFYMLTRTV